MPAAVSGQDNDSAVPRSAASAAEQAAVVSADAALETAVQRAGAGAASGADEAGRKRRVVDFVVPDAKRPALEVQDQPSIVPETQDSCGSEPL